jgi:hypothetical protein
MNADPPDLNTFLSLGLTVLSSFSLSYINLVAHFSPFFQFRILSKYFGVTVYGIYESLHSLPNNTIGYSDKKCFLIPADWLQKE